MGFFAVDRKKRAKHAATVHGLSLELLHRCECSVCPLNHAEGLRHPKMSPHGSPHPIVYMLGEAPGEVEDRKGIPFIGPAGQLLRWRMPEGWDDYLRWNNVIRTRPPGNRDPSRVEIECCRPSLERDIAATKPRAIFGFGNTPLSAVLGQTHISIWRGRWAPVEIAGHKCWYLPIFHPSFVLRTRKWVPERLDRYGSDAEFAFALDLKRGFARVEHLPEPIIHSKESVWSQLDVVLEENPDEVIDRIRRLYDQKVVGIDYETNQLRPFAEDARILTIGLAGSNGAFAFPVAHSRSQWSERARERVWQAFKHFLYHAPVRKVAHHLAFEQEWSAVHFGPGCLRAQPWEDSESQAYILDERSNKAGGGRSLDFLCQQHFGFHLKAMTGNLDRANLDRAPLEEVLRYNALDAKYHRLLFLHQERLLLQENLIAVYDEQLRRVPTVVLSQIQGVPVSQKRANKLFAKYDQKRKKVEREIAGMPVVKRFAKVRKHEFRPSSTHDVSFLLRKMLKADVEKTDEAALDTVKHPLAKAIVRWRNAAKMLSTYVEPVLKDSPNSVLYPDGRIHPIFGVTTTNTWRTSAEDPNCMHPDVELLTPNGWQRVEDWDPVTPIMQWWPDGRLAWEERPRKVERQTDSHLVWFDNSFVKGGFTLDHRVVAVSAYNGAIIEKTAGWVAQHSGLDGVPVAGNFSGPESLTSAQVRVLVALAADGSKATNDQAWRWGFKKQRKILRLRKLLNATNINFTEHDFDGVTTIYVGTAMVDAHPWLQKGFGPWILSLGPEGLKALIDEVVHWDGFSNSNSGQPTFCTGVYEQALWVQTAAHLCGQPCTVKYYPRTTDFGEADQWYVYFRKRQYSSISKAEVRPYKGKTYCPSVSSSYVLVRYRDGVFVTGQCQNWPKHEEGNKEVRCQVAAPAGCKIVSFDYAGIQARNVAMESKDPALVDAYWHDYDIHSDWRDALIREYPKWVTEGLKALQDKGVARHYRQRAKNEFVFASFFGAQPPSLAKRLGIPEHIVARVHERFVDKFRGIPSWHDQLFQQYNKYGYVSGLTGFRRRAPVSPNQIINAPIQADEALIVLDAMSALSELEDPRFQAMLEVHDDLTFLWPAREVDRNAEVVIEAMLDVPFEWAHIVPIGVEMSVGDNWGEMKTSKDLEFNSKDWLGHRRGIPRAQWQDRNNSGIVNTNQMAA